MSRIETSIAQLASGLSTRDKGMFPSQTQPNPKDQTESLHRDQANTVITLRSGKTVDNKVRMPEDKSHESPNPSTEKVVEGGKPICEETPFVEEETGHVSLKHPWLQNAKKASNVPLGDIVRSRLKQFSAMNRFKKKPMRVITEHLSAEEVEVTREMFKIDGYRQDKKITYEELKTGLQKVGSQLAEPEMKMLMEANNGDTLVSHYLEEKLIWQERVFGLKLIDYNIGKPNSIYRVYAVSTVAEEVLDTPMKTIEAKRNTAKRSTPFK
ncbi:hypothetical protein GIB67_036825 [Kingdonia uniflora]|uniref:EF-hand domain-containing protein n=1 Tax=Kingdonia uniflora TaxID=39325 RepID=A0A7J7LWS8_9MAGN|nr:hypothetical protein GIB67_036825 [Kingdonia uniflora]